MSSKVEPARTPAWVRFWLCLLSLGLACSNPSRPETELPLANTSEGLGGPFTVALAAPNPVSPVEPVLLASNRLFLGSAANIVSGTIVGMSSGPEALNAGSSAVMNDVWSRAFATIGASVRIRGTLHASQSSQGPGTTVATFDRSPRFDPPSSLSWTVTYPAGTAANVTLASGQAQTLAPGLYGSVTANQRATLTLSTGTYYLTNLTLASQSALVLDQARGPVIVYVQGTLTPDGTFGSLTGAAPDLFIGYLGTTGPTFGKFGAVFKGAIAAPFTTITLQAVSGAVHTGYFAAKDITLTAGAQVQYRFPAAAVAAANPPPAQCKQLIGNAVPAAQLSHYCKECGASDDIDNDGVRDCLDGCPYDPRKTAPGICNCGSADTDTDHDGVPDCIDQTPLDPNNTGVGQCGSVGSQIPPKPAGTPCTDTACPQSGATCNGAGVCGNRNACRPATTCRFANFYGVAYWICGDTAPSDGGTPAGQLTEPGAAQACSAKGLTLTRIDSLWQNQRIARLVSGPLWLGANSISASGQWRWSAPNTNNGDQFWSGGPTGAPVGGRFALWAPGAPASQTCAMLDPNNGGRWSDISCNESHGYICEFKAPVPIVGFTPPPGAGADPAPAVGPCIPEFSSDGGLPTTLPELQAQVDAAARGVFTGAALPRPRDGGTCSSDLSYDAQGLALELNSGAGCQYQVAPNTGVPGDENFVDCLADSDCTAFGPGFLCRQIKDDPSCVPDAAPDGTPALSKTCRGHSRCVKLTCPPADTTCGQVEVCNPGVHFDAGPDPQSNLGAVPFNPAGMFEAGLPEAALAGEYVDPPRFSGPEHTWCHMVPQDPVPPAAQPSNGKHGSSGDSTKIKFSFTPDVIFDMDAKPAALMEHGFNMHAQARMLASVELNNFLDQSFHADIINATVGLSAHRCSISNDETQFTVLGLDFLSLDGFDIPTFNTDLPSSPLHDATQKCNEAMGDFLMWANRVKKAYRDSQQLLSQYHNAKAAGGRLVSNLCETIMDTVGTEDVPLFPGGLNCYENEAPEVTINRFLDYLQAPGYGQFAQLHQAITRLTSATDDLKKKLSSKMVIDFGPKDKEESQTILSVPFAVGPVPMLLQIDLYSRYGINGQLLAELNFPYNPFSQPGSKGDNKVADVQVAVSPHASAGLGAFVGAGGGLGPFNATLGIEGQVTLAEIHAPIFGGAGLTMDVVQDFRTIPLDIGPPVSALGPVLGSAFKFGVPTGAKLGVYYKFGAGLHLDNVLKGELDARLRISFLFFSKTWRKQIVKYDGWSAHYDFVSTGALPVGSIGSSAIPNSSAEGQKAVTNVAEGATPIGVNQQQLPLTTLARLSEPVTDAGLADDAAPPDVRQVPFDASSLGSFFYDDLCCMKVGSDCSLSGTSRCCPNSFCDVPDGSDKGKCVQECKAQGVECASGGNPCCTGLFCGQSNTCQSCVESDQTCSGSHPCCSGLFCGPDNNCRACLALRQSCAGGQACCGNATCGLHPDAGPPDPNATCCLPEGQSCRQNSDCCLGSCDAMLGTCHFVIP